MPQLNMSKHFKVNIHAGEHFGRALHASKCGAGRSLETFNAELSRALLDATRMPCEVRLLPWKSNSGGGLVPEAGSCLGFRVEVF